MLWNSKKFYLFWRSLTLSQLSAQYFNLIFYFNVILHEKNCRVQSLSAHLVCGIKNKSSWWLCQMHWRLWTNLKCWFKFCNYKVLRINLTLKAVFVSDAHAIYLLVDADRKISSHYEKGKYSIGNFLKFFLSLIRNTGWWVVLFQVLWEQFCQTSLRRPMISSFSIARCCRKKEPPSISNVSFALRIGLRSLNRQTYFILHSKLKNATNWNVLAGNKILYFIFWILAIRSHLPEFEI